MKPEHTPGPWKVLNQEDGEKTIISNHNGGYICDLYENDEWVFNSKLIAESPAMFEALQAVAALDWSPHTTDPGECMSMCPVCQALDMVVNSITKVKGE